MAFGISSISGNRYDSSPVYGSSSSALSGDRMMMDEGSGCSSCGDDKMMMKDEMQRSPELQGLEASGANPAQLAGLLNNFQLQ